MAPDERRQSLIEATLPLLRHHGSAVSTKQIADAAGVAEGTIFRVFETKQDLVAAALCEAFRIDSFLAEVRKVDASPDRALVDLLSDLVRLLQDRFREIFTLMAAMGMTAPPGVHEQRQYSRQAAKEAMRELFEPYADRLTCDPEEFVNMVRMLTFAGSHPHISDGHPLTTEHIVTTVTVGLTRQESPC